MVAQHPRRPGPRGRQHDQPAARQDQLPLARPHLRPQGAGGADRALAGGAADQGGDPQPLSLQRLFRRQCLRPARRRPPLFQRRARGADPLPGGDAGRRRQRAEPARADPQPRRGARRARRLVLRAMAESRLSSPRPSATRSGPPALRRGAARRRPDRHLFRRLGAARRRPSSPTKAMASASSAPRSRATSSALAVRTVRRAGLGRAQAALVAMRLDGRVVAMVGGRDYARKPVQPRHPGPPPARLGVQAVRLSRRLPRRPDPGHAGQRRADPARRLAAAQLRRFLSRRRSRCARRSPMSSNSVAVQISERVGRDNVIRAARDLGVTTPLTPASEPAARRQQHHPARADRGLCRGRRRAATRSARTACRSIAAAGSAGATRTGR